MLNPELKGKYEVTDKVKNPKFRNALYGVIDLGTITEPMADKLVKTGHLKKVSPKKAKLESE